MLPSQVDGCDVVNLDDMFEALGKQMQTCETHGKHRKKTEIGPGEEGNTTMTLVIHMSMLHLQYCTCSLIRNQLKIPEKGVSLSLNVKNISFQQLVS